MGVEGAISMTAVATIVQRVRRKSTDVAVLRRSQKSSTSSEKVMRYSHITAAVVLSGHFAGDSHRNVPDVAYDMLLFRILDVTFDMNTDYFSMREAPTGHRQHPRAPGPTWR